MKKLLKHNSTKPSITSVEAFCGICTCMGCFTCTCSCSAPKYETGSDTSSLNSPMSGNEMTKYTNPSNK